MRVTLRSAPNSPGDIARQLSFLSNQHVVFTLGFLSLVQFPRGIACTLTSIPPLRLRGIALRLLRRSQRFDKTHYLPPLLHRQFPPCRHPVIDVPACDQPEQRPLARRLCRAPEERRHHPRSFCIQPVALSTIGCVDFASGCDGIGLATVRIFRRLGRGGRFIELRVLRHCSSERQRQQRTPETHHETCDVTESSAATCQPAAGCGVYDVQSQRWCSANHSAPTGGGFT
jgi:hypothetical protein